MIVKIGKKSGHSFKGLSAYLTHDIKSSTAKRVDWMHTHNLANEFVPSAVDEMVWTSRDAEILKAQAGLRGGRPTSGSSVKHVSLSWDPRDNPSDSHMLATGQHFLKYMGWNEHQVIFISHNDKEYRHIHLIINEIHPETGRKLDAGLEQRRAQKWAYEYEREQGIIRCEQRTIPHRERENSMPRNIWMEFKNNEREFEKSEQKLKEGAEYSEFRPESRKNVEWEIFKGIQRGEREQFFLEGKLQFKRLRSAIYHTVHEEFRERWSDCYKADRKTVGEDRRFLKDVRDQLIADEKARLGSVRDAACARLKAERTEQYQTLLAYQRSDRAEFRDRLKLGLDNSEFFHRIAEKRPSGPEADFRAASLETTKRKDESLHARNQDDVFTAEPVRYTAGRRDVANVMGRHLTSSVTSIVDSVFTLFTNLGSAKPQHDPAAAEADWFRLAAEEATKQVHRDHEQQINDEKWSRERHVYRE